MTTEDQNVGQATGERDQFTSETKTALTRASDTTHDADPLKSWTGMALPAVLGHRHREAGVQRVLAPAPLRASHTPRMNAPTIPQAAGTSFSHHF